MTDWRLHGVPAWGSIIQAEISSVGMSARPALAVAGILAGAVTLLIIIGALGAGSAVDVSPELVYPIAMVAPLLPIAVWKGGYGFRRSYLASLPTDRPRHILAKIMIGWIWLMFLVGAFVIWMLTLAIVTGGQIGIEESRVLGGYRPFGALPVDLDVLAVRWRTPGWQWAILLTVPTVTYLVGSALVLASSRTRRLLGGLVTAGVVLAGAAEHELIYLGSAVKWFEAIAEPVMSGRYGIMSLFSVVDTYALTTTAGEEIRAWGRLPTMHNWLGATLIWTVLAVASVLAVVGYDRKH